MNKRERDKQFELLWKKAKAAGLNAGRNAQVTPMVIGQHANPLDDSSEIKAAWVIPDGPCGFAWITIRPANSSFANWLKRQGLGIKGYYGGLEVSIHEHGQSITRKEAHAHAMAKVLREAGINVTVGSRLD